MTLTALLVLTAGLVAGKAGPAGPPAAQAPEPPKASAARVERAISGVTCTLRIIRVPVSPDAGMLAPVPRDVSDRIVHDSVSPCDK